MKFKNFFLLLFSLSTVQIFSQSTYFIKYKDNVDINVVNNIITSKSVFSQSLTNKPVTINFDVKHFYKINDVRISRIVKVEFDNEVSEYEFTSMIGSNPDIEYYEKSVLLKVDDVPNDSLINDQWGLKKIQAFDAWNLTKGKDGILIGIIDTGIDFLHPDLKNKIAKNPGEIGIDALGKDKSNNNIDDDNNGFIDDYMGWDFTDRVGFPFDSSGGDYLGWDNNPNDDYGHGTYIAGICAGESNNRIGISGVAPNIKIINARAFDPEGYGEEDDAAAAILYVVQMGAKVINMSFGDNAFSYVLKDVIQYAYSQNVVLVASSGNSGSNLPHYPSGYSEVISVGNSTVEDYVAGSSNYGSTLDLVAPGSLITTTSMDSSYSTVSGTSAAAPFVSAAAALILSLQDFTNDEVTQILKTTSDDILESGWDERSGAGRLNLLKALSINAPSKVTFNYPKQDFATLNDTIKINTTILSAYFTRYELLYGVGLNPDNWIKLTEGQRQIVDEDIFTLNSKNLSDTSYTLRIVVYLNNGRTLEERINFYVDRTAPKAELVNLIPAFYGDKPTIMASVYTDEPSVVKMYYRTGSSEFNYVTLDGFASNNKFVKQLHYGFIPKQLIQNNAVYEVYFEAENLVGLKTVLKNQSNYFLVQPIYNAQYANKIELPFSLPVGTLFNQPVNFTSETKNEILFSTFYPSPDLIYGLFKLENNSFVKLDSIRNQRPRDFGDFNNNGKKDLLSSIQRNGFLCEQSELDSTKLVNKYSDSTGNFWPILVDDIDNDNVQEVLSIAKDSLLVIHRINANLQLESADTLKNFTSSGYYANAYDAPFCLVIDTDNDGLKEIWIADGDGDIMSWEVIAPRKYKEDKAIETGFLTSSSFIAAGDYTGGNEKEIAVLLQSIPDFDIAPFHRLIVFNIINDSLKIIQDQAFVDPSAEFRTFQSIENSLKFENVNTKDKDELILCPFPYGYIFSYDNLTNDVIDYHENINSNSVFTGDLNNNGVVEVAFTGSTGTKFYEYASSLAAAIPYNVNGYSTDSISISLNWEGSGTDFIVYAGEDKNNLLPIDTVSTKNYLMNNVVLNKNYFFAIQSIDNSKPEPLSQLSNIITVYAHNPAKIVLATSNNEYSILVTFSERINNTIENLNSFGIKNLSFANSITAYNQYTYLVTFKERIPEGLQLLIIKDLRDFYGSPVKNDSILVNINYNPVVNNLFIVNHQIINPYLIKLEFNHPVNEASALNVENYILEPDNKPSSIEIDKDNKNIIYIHLNKRPVGAVGVEYRLKLQNLFSTTNEPLAEGAGSYLVLIGYAQNLSEVYVYPNPVQANTTKVTFAGLPQKSKIDIFNINGMRINSLEESDGNGGIDFNLKDFDGNELSSGVYIYRIIRLDNTGNEVEEKIGKFAVTK